MSSTRRMSSVLVVASASMRAPWAASLSIKGKINISTFNHPRSTGYCRHICSESLPTWCASRRRAFLTRPSYLQQPRVHRAVTSATSEAVVTCKDTTILETSSSNTSKGVPVPVSSGAVVLSRKEWMARAEAHRSRVRALTNGSVHHDHKDPIFNFLFEYYHFKPRMLLQWTPGFNVHLQDADPSERGCPLPHKAWEREPGGRGYYSPFGLDSKRRTQIEWIRNILAEMSARAPVFHCFGLHEWAMLYQPVGAEDTRRLYQSLPLRVSQEEINEMVEGKGGALGCTHFDAFRFFTPEARRLNPIQLDRESQRLHDQPGCIHANMDLFKWALKLWPLLPSEVMADALELAVACRMLDMRASPYDLTAYDRAPDSTIGKGGGKVGGLPPDSWDPSPVRIETEEGRKEYQQTQVGIYRRSMPIRRSLVGHVDRLLEAWR